MMSFKQRERTEIKAEEGPLPKRWQSKIMYTAEIDEQCVEDILH